MSGHLLNVLKAEKAVDELIDEEDDDFIPGCPCAECVAARG